MYVYIRTSLLLVFLLQPPVFSVPESVLDLHHCHSRRTYSRAVGTGSVGFCLGCDCQQMHDEVVPVLPRFDSLVDQG